MPPAKWRYKCIMISWHWFSASTGWFLESKTRFFVTSSSFLLDPAIGSGHLLLTFSTPPGPEAEVLPISLLLGFTFRVPYWCWVTFFPLQSAFLTCNWAIWSLHLLAEISFFSLIGFAGMHVLLWEACKVDRAQQSTQAPGSGGQ